MTESDETTTSEPGTSAPAETPAAAEPEAPEAPAKKKRGRRHAKKSEGSFFRELPFLLLIAFVLALLIKTFLVQAFYIPSGSMEQTLLVGDRVLVNKVVYKFRDPHRGEVVVFNGLDSFTREVVVPPPGNALESFRRKLTDLVGFGQLGERDFIKRIIGLPGDTVACCTNGHVTVNGVELDEPYLYQNDTRAFGPSVVPDGKVWVMGDHRSRSSDSRDHGAVPISRIVGRAFVVVWPMDHAKGLRVPHQIEDAKIPEGMALAPATLGLAGAMPVTVLRRRWRRRRSRA